MRGTYWGESYLVSLTSYAGSIDLVRKADWLGTNEVDKKATKSIDKSHYFLLGRKDSNLRITGPKPAALPLGHAP